MRYSWYNSADYDVKSPRFRFLFRLCGLFHRLRPERQFVKDNLFCPVVDAVHPSHALHLIGRFQGFRDTFLLHHAFLMIPSRSLRYNILQIIIFFGDPT